MQPYKQLLKSIKEGDFLSFEGIFRERPFDCSGYSYGCTPLFNAIVSSICTDSEEDKRIVRDLSKNYQPEHKKELEAAKERISSRDKILKLLCGHLQAANLINAPDLDSGINPLQIALEAFNIDVLHTLLEKGADLGCKLKVGDVEHCNLFMKALDCAPEGKSADLLEGLAQGFADRKLFEPGEKTDRKIGSQFIDYIVGLNKSYKTSLPVLLSSNAAGRNIFHSVIEKKDSSALCWLKRVLLSSNPIIEQVEKISEELELKPDLKKRILKGAEESDKSFTKHRKNSYAADLVFNSPAGECDPLELSLKTLSSPEELPFLMEVPIKHVDREGYKTVGKALEEVHSKEAHRVLKTCVKFADPRLLESIFLGERGEERLNVLCDLHKNEDGKIRDNKCIALLASSTSGKLAELAEEGAIEIREIVHILAACATPQVLQEIEEHVTVEALGEENEAGLNALEVAITSCNPAVLEWFLTKLENDLSTVQGEELGNLQNSIGEILAKPHKESGSLLHLTAKHAPQLLQQILRLSGDSYNLLCAQDAQGLLAAHYRIEEASLLDGLKQRKEETLGQPLSEVQLEKLRNDVALHAEIASGNKSALEELFTLNSENVYKVIDTIDGEKSILEVAAESKQSDLVRYILQEHKKLQSKSKNECHEIDVQLNAMESMQHQAAIEAKIQGLRTAREEKLELQNGRNKAFSKQSAETVLRAFTKQGELQWHADILEEVNLKELSYLASMLDTSMNPLVTAVQSGNTPVAEKIYSSLPGLANGSLEKLLVEKGGENELLKYGFGVSQLYERHYSPPKEDQLGARSKVEFNVETAVEKVLSHEIEKHRTAVTDKFANKGVLLTYANAIAQDGGGSDNIKDKLDGFQDGDSTLLSLKSPDGHNLGTLIAAFGNVSQWEKYVNKYRKLKSYDKEGISPAGDTSAPIGSPAQVVLLAKNFAHSEVVKREKDLLFNYFMIHYPQAAFLQNQDGENLLHTAVRCKDLIALQTVMEHESYTTQSLIEALKQKNKDGRSVLELVIDSNNPAMLKCIMENVIARGSADSLRSLLLDSRLLHCAVLNNNGVMVKLLGKIQQMLNIALSPGKMFLERQLDSRQRDPFVLAIQNKNVEIVTDMLDVGLQANKESIKDALINAAVDFEEVKLQKVLESLEMSDSEKKEILEKREQTLSNEILLSVDKVKSEKVVGERSLKNYVSEISRLAAEDGKVFKKQSRRLVKGFLSDYQFEFEKCGAALESLITSGKAAEASKIMRDNSGIVDFLENRTSVIEAILHSGDVNLVNSLILSSNKFVKNEKGDNLLHSIISHGCDEMQIKSCISAGYSLSDISESTGKSAFELIKERSPSIAENFKNRAKADLQSDQEITRLLNQVIDSVNAGKKSEDVKLLCAEMNSRESGYSSSVFLHIFSQIMSEREHGSASLLTKRLELVNYICKNVSYLKEKNPHTGSNILYMLFSVLLNSPYAVTEVEDVLKSILENNAFSAELLFEKNKSGVSAMDILARSKHCVQLLDTIFHHKPDVKAKVSFSKMLMLSVLQGDYNATSNLLEKYGHLININAVDPEEVSILECAVRNNSIQMTKLLLKHGAEINCLDSHGRNILDKMLDNAIVQGLLPSKEMVTFLISRGMDVSSTSAGISTLERCKNLERYRDSQRNRLNELLNKKKLSPHEYTEIRSLQGAKLHLNYCDIFYAAQLERARLNREVSKQVASELYKSNKMCFFSNITAMPQFMRMPLTLPQDKSSAAIIGGILNVQIRENASINVEKLFKAVKSSEISTSLLSFNEGRDVLKVQRRHDELTNYIPQKGAALISTNVKIGGKSKTIHLRVTADGGVSFDSKARQNLEMLEKMLRQDKIDFSESPVYICGVPLGKAMRSPAPMLATKSLQDAAKALKEAGASAETEQTSLVQSGLPCKQQPTQRQESI